MRRFLYDAILLTLLVLIGLSINTNDSNEIEEEIKQFESNIQNHQLIEKKSKQAALNQIEENGASEVAKSASILLKEWVTVSVESLSTIFEMIIQ